MSNKVASFSIIAIFYDMFDKLKAAAHALATEAFLKWRGYCLQKVTVDMHYIALK